MLGSRALRAPGIEFLDQRGDAEQIGQQHPFLALVVAGVADLGQEGDDLLPLGRRRLSFADKLVEMRHRRHQRLRQTAGLGLVQPAGENVERRLLAESRRGAQRWHVSSHALSETSQHRLLRLFDDFMRS